MGLAARSLRAFVASPAAIAAGYPARKADNSAKRWVRGKDQSHKILQTSPIILVLNRQFVINSDSGIRRPGSTPTGQLRQKGHNER